jgi:hypothetical protein
MGGCFTLLVEMYAGRKERTPAKLDLVHKLSYLTRSLKSADPDLRGLHLMSWALKGNVIVDKWGEPETMGISFYLGLAGEGQVKAQTLPSYNSKKIFMTYLFFKS